MNGTYGGVVISANGVFVDGISVFIDIHLSVGFPVVPGGHVHLVLCLLISHNAFSPHRPWLQMFIQILFTQVLS